MKSNKAKKNLRKEIYIVAIMFMLLFIAMIIYMGLFVQKGSKDFIYNSYNSRFSVFSDEVTRGNIYSFDGHVIAKTSKNESNEQVRLYPDDRLFSHAIGYVGKGMAGIEAAYSFDLLKSHISLDKQIENTLSGKKSPGDNLYTTFDYEAQKAAYDGMDLFDGAVIAIEPTTGKVIAMVSKPDYNPNTIAEKWDAITDEESQKSVLLNRATQGAYPPGSTFKIVTTIAYLRDNNGSDSFDYSCNGSLTIDDYKIHCSSNEKHGKEDLLKAFSNSCNSAYAYIGINLDMGTFADTASSLYFNTDLPAEVGLTKASVFDINKSSKESIIGQTAIGQGRTTVSPLHMCMLASAIANDGVLMKPYYVDRIVSAEGEKVMENTPISLGNIISHKEAVLLNEYMESVVLDGTAKKVDFGDLKVYGKTGTAEYSDNKDLTHSWFVGYASDEQGNKLAVAVIMERAGYGSKYAAPLAAKVFEAYFNK